MKKLLNGILASSLILSLGTVSFAQEIPSFEGETGVYTQTLTASESDFTMGDGGVITKYTGEGGNVVIPSVIDGKTVYGIGEKAFLNVTSIDSVTMPSTLERIESYAFRGCTNLRSVTLNEGLYFIGDCAFEKTTNLSSIWIPSTVTTLSYGAFYQSGLTSVYVPETVTTVGTLVFRDCPRLKSVIFMADIDELPEGTFKESSVLTDVYLREGIVTIGTSAFRDCTGLKEITLPSTTKTLGPQSFNGCTKLEKMDMTNTVLDTADIGSFANCTSLTEVVFPYGFRVLTIMNYKSEYTAQFENCTSLKKVVLPSTIQTIYKLSSSYALIQNPMYNCHADLVVQGYPDTIAEQYANEFSTIAFQSRGSVSSENTNPTITPTTAPELPTKPDVTTPEVTPEATPEAELPPVNQDFSDKLASPSDVKVMVNGSVVAFAPYAIDGFNYFKLTDMAFAIDGTGKQFEVTWDAEKSAINMVTGSAHRHLGNEMEGNSGKSEVAERFTSTVYKNGEAIDVLVYTINGSSYFQLDTLKGVLGIDVGWDGATGTITITA